MKSTLLSKQEKILFILAKLSKNSNKNIKFEDFVVALFIKFPKDFNLRGHEEYPDSEAIRKSLYPLKNQGMLLIRNMVLSLTDKGIDVAERIRERANKKKAPNYGKFDRYIEKEIRRINNLSCFSNFLKNAPDKIYDTDFFDYLGVSVKSEKGEFNGRLKVISDLSKILEEQDDTSLKAIYEFHNFMINKFKDIINFKLKN